MWGFLRSKITDLSCLEGMDERLVLQQMTPVVFFLEEVAPLLVGIHLLPYRPLLPTKEVEANRNEELIQSFIHSV